VLLEFSLGEKQSWLWALTKDELNSYRLPGRSRIDAASRKFYERLTARQPKRDLSESQHQQLVVEADQSLNRDGAVVSEMLFGQFESKLQREWKGKRLVIVASGSLEYTPFAALPLPSTSNRPLIADHEVVTLPSASALSLMRRESRSPSENTVAVLADPVFETNDPRLIISSKRKQSDGYVARVRSEVQTPANVDSHLDQSLRSFDTSPFRSGFSRLPFSRAEAETIAGLVPRSSLFKATDFRASRTVALSGDLSRCRIIHFATHGLLNSEHPELSGLVLSLVDEDGKAQDGFLRMHEIYDLRLTADVVVLSACQTGLGKQIRGEGLVGLTRGFMHAGAQRIVASLWQVDDLATSQLMEGFYRRMLKEKLAPATALRLAQIDMSRQKRWSSPFYWAGFVLQGDWK
jgi:CHAT domain-containing protein